MANTSLADNLAARPAGFDLGRALSRRWALDLLRALRHLHDRDPILMHRDVKPENLLLTVSHPVTLKLSDFGLAKMVSSAPILPLIPSDNLSVPSFLSPFPYVLSLPRSPFPSSFFFPSAI